MMREAYTALSMPVQEAMFVQPFRTRHIFTPAAAATEVCLDEKRENVWYHALRSPYPTIIINEDT